MQTALSVINALGFTQFRPGENDKDFSFSGPGVVVIACQDNSLPRSMVSFRLITALNADSDALAVAKHSLSHGWECEGYLFALLAAVPDRAARLDAVATLDRMCSAGT